MTFKRQIIDNIKTKICCRQAIIIESMFDLQQMSCFKFVKRTTEADYVYIQPLDGCYSYVGKIGITFFFAFYYLVTLVKLMAKLLLLLKSMLLINLTTKFFYFKHDCFYQACYN